MHLKIPKFKWMLGILVILAILAYSVSGCRGQEKDSKLTAQLLGVHQLAALKHIPGEPQLQQLIMLRAEGDKVVSRSLGEAYDFEVSNDGSSIAYIDDEGLHVVSTGGGKAAKVSELSPKFDLNTDQVRVINKVMAWSPDNSYLAFVSGGDLYVVNAIAGEEPKLLARRTPDRLTTKEGAPALAPKIDGIICPDWLDNRTLIYQDFYKVFDGEWHYVCEIVKVDIDGSDKKILIENGREPVLSPDRKKFLYQLNDDAGGKIMLAQVDGREQPRFLTDFTDANRGPLCYSWSIDGKYAIFDGFVVDQATARHTPFAGEPAHNSQDFRGSPNQLPASSPDGRWVIFPNSQGPKLVEFKGDNFIYRASEAFRPLAGLGHIQWVKGK